MNRASFADAEQWNRYIHEGALAHEDPVRYQPIGKGPYAELIRGYIGDRGREHERHLTWQAELAQGRRQHVFVEKWAGGKGWGKPWPQFRTVVSPPSSSVPSPPDPQLISEAEFAGIYAAAAFAYDFGLWLDTMVTLNWRLLGYADEEVQAGHLAFTKCLRDWLSQRGLPAAYIYSHENAAKHGVHTHIAVHVPSWSTMLPDEFRHWARGWARHRTRRWVPGAIRVRGAGQDRPGETTKAERAPWLHWFRFHYLMKSHDRSVVVQSARHSPDGMPVYLGELIAFRWRASGPVPMRQRVGASRSLGPARRLIGVPEGFDGELKKPVTIAQLEYNPFEVLRPVTATNPDVLREPVPPPPIRGPFRSAYEDGARDVRVLYPPDFTQVVQRLQRLTRQLDD
jgi:hypothetical protein